MKIRENQNFLSLYYAPNTVEIAVGETNPHSDAADWKRETKLLGQVATPRRVGEMMARWVMSAGPAAVLDPAAGLGGLLHECRQFGPHTKFVGVERDQDTLLLAKSAAPEGTKLVLADYLLAEAGEFQGIIANPPYVKAHRLAYSGDTWRGFEERFGTPLDRLTNLYALFLLKIWQDLALHGRAAVLLPAEFLNANFGEEIKKHLQNVMCPAGVVVFTPTLSLFADALTTSAIIFLEKGRPRFASSWITKAESLEEAEMFVNCLLSRPGSGDHLPYRDLKTFCPGSKWLNLLFNGVGPSAEPLFPQMVGDYFDCRRGIATGANDFFCLSRSGLREHCLDLSHVAPCVTKATDADGLVFSPQKLEALAASDRRCYLLDSSRNGSAFTNYLQIGERAGIPGRHLPSHRSVWYLPEKRGVADIWVAVFSRETSKFILNTSQAKNLTCFHGLYAKPGLKNLAPLVTLFLNSSWGRSSFAQVNRFYGDGLNKLEPKDVESLRCPALPPLKEHESKTLVRLLAKLEILPSKERSKQVDALIARYVHLPTRTAG
jgi:adenine-specific DNA-methyltransferase